MQNINLILLRVHSGVPFNFLQLQYEYLYYIVYYVGKYEYTIIYYNTYYIIYLIYEYEYNLLYYIKMYINMYLHTYLIFIRVSWYF